MEVTVIKQDYEGDVTFPEYRDDIGKVWQEVKKEEHEELNFIDYERIEEKGSL